MADNYKVSLIVKVDRGMIVAYYNQGQPIFAPHNPYLAGLIVQNRRSKNFEFLDLFNSGILLHLILDGPNYNVCEHFSQLVERRRTLLDETLGTVVVEDLDVYLRDSKITKAPRNMDRMKSLATRITLGEIWGPAHVR